MPATLQKAVELRNPQVGQNGLLRLETRYEESGPGPNLGGTADFTEIRPCRLTGIFCLGKEECMLHHVEIYVSDLVKSRSFYDVLLPAIGFTPYQEWSQGFSYREETGTYLVFVQAQEDFLAAGYHRCRVGLNHLAFTYPNQLNLPNLLQDLLKLGGKVLYQDRADIPEDQAYLTDPDGIKIELREQPFLDTPKQD